MSGEVPQTRQMRPANWTMVRIEVFTFLCGGRDEVFVQKVCRGETVGIYLVSDADGKALGRIQ